MGTDPDTDTIRLVGTMKSIAATLGAGADTMIISGLNFAGDVTIDRGSGAKELSLIGLATQGGLTANGGGADDTVNFLPRNIVVGKNLALSTVGSLGAVSVIGITDSSVTLGKAAIIRLGEGDDTLTNTPPGNTFAKIPGFTNLP